MLLRFYARSGLAARKQQETRLSIDEHNLYYEKVDREGHGRGSRQSILLYNLK